MAIDLRKFTARFVDEARERLQAVMAGLRALEEGAEEPGSIDELFRAMHTIKGTARMIGQTGVADAAHRLEDLLDGLRNGTLPKSPESLGELRDGTEGLAELVERLAAGEERPTAAVATAPAAAGTMPGAQREPPPEATTAPAAAPGAMPDSRRAPQPEAAPAPAAAGTAGTTTAAPVQAQAQANSASPPVPSRAPASETARVRVEKIDELVRLAEESFSGFSRSLTRLGELAAIEREAIAAATGSADSDAPGGAEGDKARLRLLRERLGRFRRALKADLIERESLDGRLRAAAMSMRMLPLSVVFDPAARMARSIARELGKEIDCIVSGADIELDREIIDRLGEPVLHLVRNAIDHGIEEPGRRAAVGKPPRGTLRLSARQSEGTVLVEIGDDGQGLRLEAIRAKAERLGLASSDTGIGDREAIEFIFLPGFSTSETVTDLSGRGVGLDAVKHTIVSDLKGGISVDSSPGEGARFILRLPPSLAIMRVIFVRSGGSVFGVAAQDAPEILDTAATAIEESEGDRIAILEEDRVGIRPLTALLGIARAPEARRTRAERPKLLVLAGASGRLAVEVDALVDERESTVKPLPAHLRNLPLVSGMAMSAEGAPIPLLSATGLVEASRGYSFTGPEAPGEPVARPFEILVVDDSRGTREIERDVLEAHGYRITLAEDGVDAFAKAMDRPFDAVITDVEMPRMDGFELTGLLRSKERYRDIPIVVITSRSREEDRRRGIEAGADAYIIKSDFRQESLLETLRNLGL